MESLPAVATAALASALLHRYAVRCRTTDAFAAAVGHPGAASR